MAATEMRIPGTVLLVDAQGVVDAEHGQQARDILLIPQPSNDPDDPLRWTATRKRRNMICALMWCFFDAALISGLSPAYLLIEKDTGISVADLSTGNGLLFLFLGWGAMITQCLALNYGRRITLLMSVILAAGMTLWTAYIRSRGEFFANRILLGIFCSPQETLIEVIVGDIFFAHDRGFYMGAYSWTLWCGAFLCPVATGYVAQNLGWRWIQYILAVMCVGMALITFFFFEETMFYRRLEVGLHATIGISGGRHSSVNGASEYMTEKDPDSNAKADSEQTDAPQAVTGGDSFDGKVSTKTYLQKLKVWGHRVPEQPNTFKLFHLPIQLLFMFPGMVFGGFLVGGILGWYNVVGGSLALILGSPPYNFSANSIGLTYLAAVVGVTIGCFLSGWTADYLTVRLARRNGGIMEPEHRLWTSVVGLIMHPAGCLLYGVGASYHIHWVGVVIGLGMIGITLPMGANLAFTYVLDSYKELAGEGLVSIILIRNMMGFAFGYAVVPMIQNLGLRNSFIVIAILGLALWSTAVVMIFWGKRLRQCTAASYWALVERYGATTH